MQTTVSINMFGIRLNRIRDANNKHEFNKLLIVIKTQSTNIDVTSKQYFIGKTNQLELTLMFKTTKLVHMGPHNVS